MPDSKFILDTPPPFTVKQIFGAPEIDPAAQNIQDETLESLWTVQQFSEVNGKPWLALREHNLDGSIQRQFTGTSEEIAALTAANNISARPLPAVSEEHFYSHLLSSDRDYELGRQFAASSSQEIPYQFAPMDLDRFSAGRNDRLSEQQIRAENQVQLQPDERRQMVDVFEQYGLDTGFQTASVARAWAEKEVQQIAPSAPQIGAETSEVQTSRSTNSRRENQEQHYEGSADQSFGMAV